jgi:hypothetical protein
MDLERRAFALRHLYVYPRLRIAYTSIPKNASTSLKRTFGSAQGWLADDAQPAHRMRPGWWLSGLARYAGAEERVVVIRDPFDRILSGFLHKMTKRNDAAIGQAMATGLAATCADPDDVTFAGFVEYLARTTSQSMNSHWRPQSDFLVGSYTRRIRFEHLAEDTAFLVRRGMALATAQGHGTSAIRRDLGPGWGYCTVKELRLLRRREGVLPLRENMYDDRLREMVADRFAADVDLARAPAADRLQA